jgi:hypothetical protein
MYDLYGFQMTLFNCELAVLNNNFARHVNKRSTKSKSQPNFFPRMACDTWMPIGSQILTFIAGRLTCTWFSILRPPPNTLTCLLKTYVLTCNIIQASNLLIRFPRVHRITEITAKYRNYWKCYRNYRRNDRNYLRIYSSVCQLITYQIL